jgi:GTPase SAR1 family protein
MWRGSVHARCCQRLISCCAVLVGTKSDLLTDPAAIQRLRERGLSPVSREQAEAMAKEIGAVAYCETSSLTQKGLKVDCVSLSLSFALFCFVS